MVCPGRLLLSLWIEIARGMMPIRIGRGFPLSGAYRDMGPQGNLVMF